MILHEVTKTEKWSADIENGIDFEELQITYKL